MPHSLRISVILPSVMLCLVGASCEDEGPNRDAATDADLDVDGPDADTDRDIDDREGDAESADADEGEADVEGDGGSWQGGSDVSIVGVHWFSGDGDIFDGALPVGRRGWNVELVFGSNDVGHRSHALEMARQGRDAGLVNIIRIDYRPGERQTVPTDRGAFEVWSQEFFEVVDLFLAEGLSTRFIVGNEPMLDGICPRLYADAYIYLHERRPEGIELLVAGPNAFGYIETCASYLTSVDWIGRVADFVGEADGFAIHTYGDPTFRGGECADPRAPCRRPADPFDWGFQHFRDQIDAITAGSGRFAHQPFYITEFNTDINGLGHPDPSDNYAADVGGTGRGWIELAFEAIRVFNEEALLDPDLPQVFALCWFVDRNDSEWSTFSLHDRTGALGTAREDLVAAAHDPANHSVPARWVP